MKKTGHASLLGDIVKGLVSESHFEERCQSGRLVGPWQELFGPDSGLPVGRKGDCLIVRVEGSARRYESGLRKNEMLGRLREGGAFPGVRDIRFVEN